MIEWLKFIVFIFVNLDVRNDCRNVMAFLKTHKEPIVVDWAHGCDDCRVVDIGPVFVLYLVKITGDLDTIFWISWSDSRYSPCVPGCNKEYGVKYQCLSNNIYFMICRAITNDCWSFVQHSATRRKERVFPRAVICNLVLVALLGITCIFSIS